MLMRVGNLFKDELYQRIQNRHIVDSQQTIAQPGGDSASPELDSVFRLFLLCFNVTWYSSLQTSLYKNRVPVPG